MPPPRMPRPRGTCPICGRDCQVRADGMIGQHRVILERWYRGQQCIGVGQLPLASTEQA
jgi:hypothetical protein